MDSGTGESAGRDPALLQTLKDLERAKLERTALLNAVGHGVYGVDREGRCTFINRAGLELLGYERDEALGRNMHDLIHHTHPDGSPYPKDACPLVQSFDTGRPVQLDSETLAASHNHAIAPAHAHLNLLGWVSLFLFGMYYERRPKLDASRLALVQVTLWSVGTVILAAAVAGIYSGYPGAEPLAAVASFLVLGGMLLFAFVVFRLGSSAAPIPTVSLTPAE